MFYKLSAAVRRNRKWLVMLAGVIVFVTTYALILPAITIDKDTALEEPGLEVVLQDDETAASAEDGEEPAEQTDADPAEDVTQAEEMPAVSLEETVGGVSVKVEAEEGVFPADTTMVLNEVDDKKSLDSIENAVEDAVKDVQAVEVAFRNADGDPVEPQDSYTMTVEPVTPADSEETQQVVVSLNESGEAAVVEPAQEDEAAQMVVAPDDVPVVALVETEVLTTTFLSASGKTYEATVTFDSAAKLPEGAHLSLKEIKQSSKDYRQAKQILEEAGVIGSTDTDGGATLTIPLEEPSTERFLQPMAIGGGFTASIGGDSMEFEMDVLDLSILDKNGDEIEPAAAVQVEITLKSLPKDMKEEEFISSAKVTHLRETGEGVQAEVVASNLTGEPGTIAVKNDEAVINFETDSFSTYTISWGRTGGNRATVHYGYMEGDSFVEFDQNVFSNGVPSISRSNAPNYLIYDVAGYEFDNSYLIHNSTLTEIQPFLTSTSTSNYTYYRASSTLSNTSTGSLSSRDNIYMVYTPKAAPTNGGTPLVRESAVPPEPPEILKESENNHDGTRTLSLSITGHEKPMDIIKLADVILVFDISGSMEQNRLQTGETRLEGAKQSVHKLSQMLLDDPRFINVDGDRMVRMSLVTFSNSAQLVQPFTERSSEFNEAFGNLTADGGTNWQKALQIADEMPVDPDRATLVVFVTDGDPTWRMTRYGVSDVQLRNQNDMHTGSTTGYYRLYDVFGQGNSDDQGRNYDAALIPAKSIVSHNKHFFSIAIGDSAGTLAQFTEESGAGPGHSFTVHNEEGLTQAFNDIFDSLQAYSGFGHVDMVDGITGLTNLFAKTPVVNVDEGSFTYTKTVEGVEQSWNPRSEGANEAVYQNGSVEWHMGDNFQLQDGVTYKVSFKVWPSQEATDIVTDLNNGLINYDDLEPEIKAQIQEANGYYTVKTNEDDAHVTYSKSKRTASGVEILGEPLPPVYFPEVPPLVVETMPMTLEKVFEDAFGDETGDGVGADRPSEVHLTLECRPMGSTSEDDWEPFPITYVNPAGDTVHTSDIWLSEANNWKTTFYVSPGLRDKYEAHLNEGHEYRLTEEDTEYHYELFSEYLNPYLQGHESPVPGMDQTLAAAEEVYVTPTYGGDTDGSEALTAKNIVKGGINLFKHVNGAGAGLDPNAEFTIRGWIRDPNGNPYLFDQANDEREDKSQKASETGTPLFYIHQNDPLPYHFYNANGDRVIYKGHFSDTSDIEFKIKDGEQIRFPIIPTGCTYQFWEVDGDGMPTGFVLESVEGVARDNLLNPATGKYEFFDSSDLSKYPVVDSENRIGGTIVGNTLFRLDFYNRYVQPNHISVTKTLMNADGTKQVYSDKTFTINGYIHNRFGRGYTFDPALDDRTDKSQGIPESEYASHTWDDHQDDPIAYNIIDKDGNFVIYKGHFPNTDQITVELRSGDTLEFLNVPERHSYQFYEDTGEMEDPDSNYEFVSSSGEAVVVGGGTAVQPNVTQNDDGFTVVSGTVHENEDHSIEVVNKTKSDAVDLQLEKVDALDSTRKLNGATFQLFADAEHEHPATDSLGNEIGEITTGGFADDQQTVPLGTAYIGNLLPGTYYLVETNTPPGYLALEDHVIITVSASGVTVLQAENAAAENVYTDGNMVTIVVTNTTGTELPHTGGPGTFLFTSGGLFMMAAAMIYLICVRRRERRLE